MTFSVSTRNRTFSVEFSYTDWKAARKRESDVQDQTLENRMNALSQHPTLQPTDLPDPPYILDMP